MEVASSLQTANTDPATLGSSPQGGTAVDILYKAEVRTNAGIREVIFPQLESDRGEKILIRFSRFKEISDTIKADMEIFYRTFQREEPVYDNRLNLLADRAKRSAADLCSEQIGGFTAWGNIINNACRAVVKDYRTGEPIVELRDVPQRLRQTFTVFPVCPSNQPTIIFGMGGLGKSLIACYLATRASLGAGYDVDLGDRLSVTKPHKILYLDYEADAEEVRDRFHRLSLGIGVSMPSVQYRFCTQRLSDEIETIQEVVNREEITMVIVDSAGPASGGEPEKSSNAMDFFTALRTLRCTTLVIAHQAKPQPGTNVSMPFGSAFWWNLARSIWQIDRAGEPGEDRIEVALLHKKVNTGSLQAALGFSVDFDEGDDRNGPGWIHLESMNLSDSELRSKLPLHKLIPALLSQEEFAPNGMLSREELSQFIGKPLSTINPQVSRLKNKKPPVLFEDSEGKLGLEEVRMARLHQRDGFVS